MKKKLHEMDCKDAEYIFHCHSDGGRFEHNYWSGYHENGWGNITQKFKCHILEADKPRLFKRFDITEEEYATIPMPQKIYAWTVIFAEGDELHIVPLHKIRQEFKKRLGYTKSQLKGKMKEVAELHNIELYPLYKDKFQRWRKRVERKEIS